MANNRTLLFLGKDVLNRQPVVHMETMIVMMSLVALLRSVAWTAGNLGVWIDRFVKAKIKAGHDQGVSAILLDIIL